MDADSKLEAVSKLLTGTGVAAGITLFTVTGFLATRAYLSALGISEHAAISVNEYLQYGGRIIFVLAMQLAPIMALALLAAAPIVGHAGWLSPLLRRRALVYFLLTAIASFSVYLEFSLLTVSDPVFTNGRVHLPENSKKLQLLSAEIATAVTALVAAKFGQKFWSETHSAPSHRTMVMALFLLCGTQVFMLPLCFGQVAMIPRNFDIVVLSRGKDQPPVKGALVFSDDSAHFVFSDRNMVEVPRSSIKEIRYVGRSALKDLSQ